MKHRIAGTKLGRSTAQRKSLFKNLLMSLFTHGEIETTEAKAKAIKGIADRLVSKAQMGTIPARRLLERFFGTKQAVNQLVDQVAPAMKDRKSGFTRIVRLGKRMGDDSMMVKMELVTKPEKKEAAKESAVVKPEASVKKETKAKAVKKEEKSAEVETTEAK